MDTTALTNIGSLIIGAAGLAFTIWTRLTARRAATSAKEAATSAQQAAGQSKTAADQSQAALDQAQYAHRSTQKQSENIDDALLLLAEQVGASLGVAQRSLAQVDRMADQNDTWFATYTQLAALIRDQHRRITALEEDAAARETEEHVTGLFRLRTKPPETDQEPFIT